MSCARFVDKNQVLTSSGDKTCILWDVEKSALIKKFEGHTGDVECLAMNPQHHTMFVSGSVDSICKVWDTRAEKDQIIVNFMQHREGTDVNAVGWFPEGKAFVSGGDDKTVRLFDIRAYKQLNLYSSGEIEGSVTSVSCSKSGYYIIVGYDEKPYCLAWNTMTSDREGNMDHKTRVSCLMTSPDGKCVATGCWDRTLRIWGNMDD